MNPPLSPTSNTLPELWACHICQTIGLHASALGHELATGHTASKVPDDLALGVRQQWAKEGRSLIDGAVV